MEPLEQRMLLAATFTSKGSMGLLALSNSSVAVGNRGIDKRLEILVTGDSSGGPVTKIYQNDGTDQLFADVIANLPGVSHGSVAWGDYNNDNLLDILLTGTDSSGSPLTKVYQNNGGNHFADSVAVLTNVTNSSVAWGDYDNDGRLDILLTGTNGADQPITMLYHNDGGGHFTDSGAVVLENVDHSSVAWGDYDADGLLDILLTGMDVNDQPLTRLYHNDGGGQFSDAGAPLTDVGDSAVAWGDYDNDGLLDIVLTGLDFSSQPIATVYHNDTQFSDAGAGLPGVADGSAAWGDCDGDGRLDLLLSGTSDGGTGLSKVYGNADGGVFTDLSASLAGLTSGTAVWGDYDFDSRIDIVLVGSTSATTSIARIYQNSTLSGGNTLPEVPTELSANIDSANSVTLSWVAPTDIKTPSEGLSYNLRVGTTPGGTDIVNPMANLTSGVRQLSARGLIQGTSWTIELPTAHVYYWSVQAVDTSFGSSKFATEGSFSTLPQEITVLEGTTSITSGQTTPINFGTVAQGATGPTLTKTFTIRNDGGLPLTLTTPFDSPAHFTVSDPITAVLAATESTTFTVTLDTGTLWTGTETISLGNDDGNENPFTFVVSGAVIPLDPEITVLDSDGTAVVSSGASFDLGTVTRGAIGPRRTFTIRNDGSRPLTLSAFTGSSHFTISNLAGTSLTTGQRVSFTVALNTGASWKPGGTEQVSFLNNDADNDDGVESPFTLSFSGAVDPMPPEIVVLDPDSKGIVSGQSPATAISIGSEIQGAIGTPKTFTIRNLGDLPLTLTPPTATGPFIVGPLDKTSLGFNETATFTVTLDTSAPGPASGQISLANNDENNGDGVENPFTFWVSGTVSPVLPEIAVSVGGENITSGQTAPIPLGSAEHGAKAPSVIFTIRNEGQQALTLSDFTTTLQHFTISQPDKTTLAFDETATFTATLKTDTPGPYSELVSFTNNDANNGDTVESPFTFWVSGTVTDKPPEITVLDKMTGIVIVNGQTTIDVGTAHRFGVGPSKTFTIRNDGDLPLNLSPPFSNTARFTVGPLDKTSLGFNETATFTVTLDTSDVGPASGQISLGSNDADNGDGIENPFTFMVSGTVDAARMEVTSYSHAEGQSGITSFPFTVNRLGPSTDWLTVNYATVGVEATASVDFVNSSGKLTFAPGQTQSTIRVAVRGDKRCEYDETFTLDLTDPATRQIVGQGTGRILDDDKPKVSINDVKPTNEGAPGTTFDAIFTVTLSAVSDRPTTVYYATVNGTASGTSDYQAAPVNASVVILAGQTRQTIPVTVNGDSMYEANETFKVSLTSADGAIVARRTGTATIRNDDIIPPSVKISDGKLVTDALSSRVEFVVELSAQSGLPATVKYATVNGTAKAGKDFKSTAGTHRFDAGQTQWTISVPVLNVLSSKDGKAFSVKLSSPTKARLGSPSKVTYTFVAASPGSASLLEALAAARRPTSKTSTSQYGPAVDEALRLLMLTAK